MAKVKSKTPARNNVLKKLSNLKWGGNLVTIWTTALSLSYSTAEYTCPLWERSARAHTVNPGLNYVSYSITGYIQPSIVSTSRYRSPSYKEKCCGTKRKGTNWKIPDIHYIATPFIRNVWNQKAALCMTLTNWSIVHPHELWSNHLQSVPHKLLQTPRESLCSGASVTWLEWKYLNRLRTMMGRRKHNMKSGSTYKMMQRRKSNYGPSPQVPTVAADMLSEWSYSIQRYSEELC